MFVDAHAHLDRYEGLLPQALEQIDRSGVLTVFLQETTLVGEADLDCHFVEDESQYDAQPRVFECQRRWAARLGKPVSLHTKGAEREVLETLSTFDVTNAIIHWYSDPRELVDDYLVLGCSFSIGVEALFSAGVGLIAAAIAGDRLLLETDNPGGHQWLAGAPGMPIVLLDVLAKLAELRHMAAEELETQVADIWQRLEGSAADA